MPNYLGIVREAAQFSGAVDSRTISGIDDSPRVSQLSALVAEAWTNIQTTYEAWRFLRVEFPDTAVLSEGASAFTAASLDLENWSDWILGTHSGRVRLTIWPAADANRDQERELTVAPEYESFRRSYQRGTSFTTPPGPPQVVSVDDQDRLVFWPTPDVDYRIAGTYRRSAQVLTQEGDIPIVEEQFHNAITWAAVALFHQVDESLPGVLQLAELRAESRLGALRRRYLPVGSVVYRPLGRRRGGYLRRYSTPAPT